MSNDNGSSVKFKTLSVGHKFYITTDPYNEYVKKDSRTAIISGKIVFISSETDVYDFGAKLKERESNGKRCAKSVGVFAVIIAMFC